MSKKHFQAVADVMLKARRNATGLVGRKNVSIIAEGLADTFADLNPNFDRERFLVACGTHNSGVTVR